MGVPQEGGQFGHMALDVNTRLIPPYQRFNCKCMPAVMQPRSVAFVRAPEANCT